MARGDGAFGLGGLGPVAPPRTPTPPAPPRVNIPAPPRTPSPPSVGGGRSYGSIPGLDYYGEIIVANGGRQYPNTPLGLDQMRRDQDRMDATQFHNENLDAQWAMFEEQMAAQEAELARARALVSDVNEAFGDRGDIYDQYGDLTYEANLDILNRQKDDAGTGLQFRLARAGLAGGSADTDAFSELGRQYDRKLLEQRNYADQQARNLRATDEGIRGSYLSLAQSGRGGDAVLGGINQSIQASNQLAKTPVVNPNLGNNQFSGIANALGQALYGYGVRNPIYNPTGTDQQDRNVPNLSPRSSYAGRVS